MQITDRKSAEAWLKDQPHPVQVVFAARCTLRAWPAIMLVSNAVLRENALPVPRAILTSGVAGICPTPEVMRSAADAVEVYAKVVAAPAAAAARSAATATSRSAARAAAEADAISSDEGESAAVFLRPLWPDGALPKGLPR